MKLLREFYNNAFHFNEQNIHAVKNALKISSFGNRTLYGKTGTGRVNGQDINGWFIGLVEKSGNVYYFATNIQDDSDATGSHATEISTTILSDLDIWK